MTKTPIELLEYINVLNYDDGKEFTRADRLDRIGELLWDSDYRRINPQGLFHLYAKQPLSRLPKHVTLISSHIDCQSDITECFTEIVNESEIRGTFDNSLTNAVILFLMLEGALPDHVVVAFTGDEEENSAGVKDVAHFLQDAGLEATCMVLDVTDMGWPEKCDFTIENDFWDDELEEKVLSAVMSLGREWRFVPENIYSIPQSLPDSCVIFEEAEPDESWDFEELGIECFSACIPVFGSMHSNSGVLARLDSIYGYLECVRCLACVI